MVDQADAALLRRWAMQCSAQAQDPRTSGDERDRLLKMRRALLEQAEMQDWLAGQSPGEQLPASGAARA